MRLRKKGFSLIPNTLAGLLVDLALLVLALAVVGILLGKGQGAIAYLKNLFGFR